MKHELHQSISQGDDRENAQENGRMEEITNLLYSSSRKNEEEHDAGSTYRGNLYSEQSLIESYAEAHKCWYSLDDIFNLGTPGPSGSENDTYVDKNGGIVYKTNNLIHTGSFYKLFRRLLIHNELFPQTSYQLIGFTGYKGRTIYPLLAQKYIENAIPATPKEIKKHMLSLGFEQIDDWTYQYKHLRLSDLKPKNVLKDEFGDFYIIDVEIQEKQ